MTTHMYAIGDSFAFGQGLLADVPGTNGFSSFNNGLRETVYSGIMAKRLGIPNYQNEAMPGASNDRTVRRLITDLTKLMNSGVRGEDIFAVISITHSARIEVFHSGRQFYHQLINNAPPLGIGFPEMKTYFDVWVTYFDHLIENCDRYCLQIINMQYFLEKHNIKYLMTNSMNEQPEFYNYLKNQNASLNNLINKSLYPDIDVLTSFSSWVRQNGLPMTPCFHPTEAGHLSWAERLLKYIEEKEILK